MKFTKYPKIESDTSKYISNNRTFAKATWVATEKIHGANFSIHYDISTEEIKFAKRTGFLEPDEHFYNYQILVPELTYNMETLVNNIKKENTNISIIRIYGELFGGWYPTESQPIQDRFYEKKILVPLEERAIQEGIYYSNGIHFMVFDVMLNDKLLNWKDMVSKISGSGFRHVPVIKYGPRRMLNNIDVQNLRSKVPPIYGFKLIEGNNAEGVVLRCYESDYPHKIKIKRTEFYESNQSFDLKRVAENKKNDWTINYTLGIITNMMTRNRLINSISHVGPKANIDTIVNEMTSDIINELSSINETRYQVVNYPYIYFNLKDEVNKMVTKFIRRNSDLVASGDIEENQSEEE